MNNVPNSGSYLASSEIVQRILQAVAFDPRNPDSYFRIVYRLKALCVNEAPWSEVCETIEFPEAIFSAGEAG